MRRHIALSVTLAAALCAGGMASAQDFFLRRGSAGTSGYAIGDITPDDFDFTDLTAQSTATLVSSNQIILDGFADGIAVSVGGDGGPQFRLNGGDWVTSATGHRGDSLQLRMTTSATPAITLTATLSAGTLSRDWSTTTAGYHPGCLSLFNSGTTADGTYTIDPDGAGGDAPFSVYCLMSQDGGGWTRLNNAAFTSGPTVNGSGLITGTVNNNGTCNTHYWWTISGVKVSHTEYRAILTRMGTTLQCSYMTGFNATSYWNGSSWVVNPSTCSWSQPWAYCSNCTGTGGLPQIFRYNGTAQSSYTYTTACSAESGNYSWEFFVR